MPYNKHLSTKLQKRPKNSTFIFDTRNIMVDMQNRENIEVL
jgi:hypothetical protein